MASRTIVRSLVVLPLIFFCCKTFSCELPTGWRKPSIVELADEERDSRHNAYESDSRYSYAQGDFNGDGKVDSAYLLVSTDFQGDGLFLCLSTQVSDEWHELFTNNWDEAYPGKGYVYTTPSMGIGTLSPEVFRKYVSRAVIQQDDITPSERDYTNPALDFFKFGSAGSLFFWSTEEQRLVRFWYSD